MARLFVANCSRQHQEIHYRVDLNDQGRPEPNARFAPAKRINVAPGRQECVGGDLSTVQIEAIITQLRLFGAVAVEAVPRLKAVAHYVYDIDKPVSADIIRWAQNINSGVLIEQGRVRRRRAAVAANEAVTHAVANSFAAAGIDATPATLDVEIEQLDQSEAGERRIEEGFRIDPNAPKEAPRA